MKSTLTFLLLLVTLTAKGYPRDEQCQNRILANTTVPSGLNFNITSIAQNVIKNTANANLSNIAEEIFEKNNAIIGLVFNSKSERGLALSVFGKLKIFKNVTAETSFFWNSLNGNKVGWGRAFQECEFLRTWVYAYSFNHANISVGFFVELRLDRCDRGQDEIFDTSNRCDEETTHVGIFCII